MLFVVGLLLGCVFAKPFPSFPSAYHVELSMKLPQWEGGFGLHVAQPVRAWYDADKGERLEYWSRSDPVINVKRKSLLGFESTWSYVRDSSRSCHRDILPSLSLASALPLHRDNWVYAGVAVLGNSTCDKWTRTVPENGANNSFVFFARSNVPVFYSYRGDSSSTAGYLHSPNYDAFDISYSVWKPGSWDSSILSAPCVPETNSTSRYGGFLHAEFKRHFELDGKGRVFVPTMKMSDLPAEVDWDAKGFVIPVKDQGDCGSCYTFGSTAAVESAFAIKHNQKPISLSEQVLLDCSWKHGNRGCWGGSQAGCYKSMIGRTWPMETEYTQYRQNPGTCLSNVTTRSGVRVVDYKYIISNHAMMEAVALHGPVAVAISTYPAKPFTFYSGGVFDDLLCNPIIPDHVVLVVGYGTDATTGKPFWRLKNQWSSFWGEAGFMRITRRYDDCGVVSYGVLPIVE